MDQQDEKLAEVLAEELGEAELVVADTNKFKIKLGIGEDAFAVLKGKKLLETIWDANGVIAAGKTGAAVAAAPTVASVLGTATTSGGFLGIGAATTMVTPVGWIIAAAIASGGAYYGAKRLYSSTGSSNVETIPKFINTPIDLLGDALFRMIAGLALKVANFSAPVDDAERQAIIDYFSEEWGISPDYARRALPLIELQIKDCRLKDMARTLAEYQVDNPDCNPDAIRKHIREFLEEIAHADGELDEKEELAIEVVEREFSSVLSTQAQLMRKAGQYSLQAAGMAESGVTAVASGTMSAINSLHGSLSKRIGSLFNRSNKTE